MSWSSYASFLSFAVLLILVPGPDTAVVLRNTLAGGRRRGLWSSVGIAGSNLTQGALAATGLGVLVVRAQPVFEAITWAGIAYLTFLAVQAFRSAWRGEYASLEGEPTTAAAASGLRQGYLSNITNPKVLVFYLAVLPQFLGPHPSLGALLLYAVSHAVIGFGYLLVLVWFLHRLRRVLARRAVRRGMDAATGAALVGFGARLAVEHG